MKKLQDLMNEISKWSDMTFDNGNFSRNRALPISYHLQKESVELTKSISTCQKIDCFDTRISVHEELADVFMLLLDTATHFGINADELMTITHNKLEVNKKRKWGHPDENGVVEHVRDVVS